jgi:hypothetical protein
VNDLQEVEATSRKASSRTPILSLVDRDYLQSVGSIPRAIWEPLSFHYSEHDESVARIKQMDVPPELESVRQEALGRWRQVNAWLDQIFLNSQSVDALRSWQLTNGLQAQNGQQQRPSAAVMPNFPQPEPPGKPRGERKKGWAG